MAEENNGPSGFKVVDRRNFSSGGDRREEVPGDAPKAESSAPLRQPVDGRVVQPTHTAEPEAEPPDDFGAEAAGFDTLVSYLSTTAMFQLGALAGPGGERIPPDLPNARRTIDLLEILQQKTQGNLSTEEARFLDEALYELRLAYLEMEKRQARRVK